MCKRPLLVPHSQSVTVSRKHQYTGLDMQMSAIDDELDTAKKISTDLVGPVYDADLSVNHFKEVVMHAEAIRQE